MSRWKVLGIWLAASVVMGLFWGSLAGTVTQLLWGHWGGWVMFPGCFFVMMCIGALCIVQEDR